MVTTEIERKTNEVYLKQNQVENLLEEFRQSFEELEILKTPINKDEEAKKEQEIVLDKIIQLLNDELNPEFYDAIKTKNGNTQSAERLYTERFVEILQKNDISYDLAPDSQKSEDFRNVAGIIGFNLELKKSDTLTIICNDTCPRPCSYYIVFSTSSTKDRKPQVFWINGARFLEGSHTWLPYYQWNLEFVKNMVCRGEGKQKHKSILSSYARPTYKVDISSFIKKEAKAPEQEKPPRQDLKKSKCSVCGEMGHNKANKICQGKKEK